MKNTTQLNELSRIILDASISVHREMGPGLLESVYHECLVEEFLMRNLTFDSLLAFPLVYKGRTLKKVYVIDLLVEDEIVIELKAVENILPIHEAQIISYLRLTNKRLGFLINFNVPKLKDGFCRYVHKL